MVDGDIPLKALPIIFKAMHNDSPKHKLPKKFANQTIVFKVVLNTRGQGRSEPSFIFINTKGEYALIHHNRVHVVVVRSTGIKLGTHGVNAQRL